MKASLLLIVLLMISVFIPFLGFGMGNRILVNDQNIVTSSRTPHSPILITCDEDFVTQSWPGSGNETHPYLVEGLEISSDSPCIEIRNVSVHYIIDDCALSGTRGTDTGAVKITDLSSSSRGTIAHCNIYNSSIGMYVFANDMLIEENTIWNCSSTDVWIQGYHGQQNYRTQFLYNTLNTEGVSSLKWSTQDSRMIGNTITCIPHTDPYSEVSLGGYNFTMSDNIFLDARVMISGTELLISDSIFTGHDHESLHIGYSDDVTVTGCQFSVDEVEYPWMTYPNTNEFYITNTNNCRVIDSISESSKIIIEDSTNVTVNGCDISNNTLYLGGILGSLNVSQNHISGSYYGIFTVSGNYSGIISENIISECQTGIWLNANGLIIKNNTIFNNSLGIYARGDDNHIFYNRFIENDISGMDVGTNTWDDSVSLGNYWDKYFMLPPEYDIHQPPNDRWPVYLDDDVPVITAIDPITIMVGSNVTLNFTATDNTPLTYSITLDGELLEGGEWNGISIIIEITSLSAGIHEVVAVFSDINNNSAACTVMITCQEALPMTLIITGVGIAAVIVVLISIIVMKRKQL